LHIRIIELNQAAKAVNVLTTCSKKRSETLMRLHRAGMEIATIHDDRHVLGEHPLSRESVPYCIVLPDERIGLFTYTWVNREGEAGAALGIWGPGIGPKPIGGRLADRSVSATMGFDNWHIDGFSMRQDLKFRSAQIRWQTAEISLAFEFDGFHPPYAYGSHREGCPPYAASDRIEQSGRVKGTLDVGGRSIAFDGFGHRDHSWGTRDWTALHYYRWLQCQAPGDVSVHFWEFFALGRRQVRGYVCKDGLLAEITDLDFAWKGDAKFNQTEFKARITDEAGRTTRLEGNVFGVFPMMPTPDFVLNEGAATVSIDGIEGPCWLEMGWPSAYLEHVRSAGLYG
jgi:hypothetical protein